jgi:hypothetical protein
VRVGPTSRRRPVCCPHPRGVHEPGARLSRDRRPELARWTHHSAQVPSPAAARRFSRQRTPAALEPRASPSPCGSGPPVRRRASTELVGFCETNGPQELDARRAWRLRRVPRINWVGSGRHALVHDRHDLTDDEWAPLEPLLPGRVRRRGGQWVDHRKVINGVMWRTRTVQVSWEDAKVARALRRNLTWSAHRHVHPPIGGSCGCSGESQSTTSVSLLHSALDMSHHGTLSYTPSSLGSITGQFVGGDPSGVCGATEKVGEQFEFGFSIVRAELVHRGVHPRVEAEQLRVAVT